MSAKPKIVLNPHLVVPPIGTPPPSPRRTRYNVGAKKLVVSESTFGSTESSLFLRQIVSTLHQLILVVMTVNTYRRVDDQQVMYALAAIVSGKFRYQGKNPILEELGRYSVLESSVQLENAIYDYFSFNKADANVHQCEQVFDFISANCVTWHITSQHPIQTMFRIGSTVPVQYGYNTPLMMLLPNIPANQVCVTTVPIMTPMTYYYVLRGNLVIPRDVQSLDIVHKDLEVGWVFDFIVESLKIFQSKITSVNVIKVFVAACHHARIFPFILEDSKTRVLKLFNLIKNSNGHSLQTLVEFFAAFRPYTKKHGTVLHVQLIDFKYQELVNLCKAHDFSQYKDSPELLSFDSIKAGVGTPHLISTDVDEKPIDLADYVDIIENDAYHRYTFTDDRSKIETLSRYLPVLCVRIPGFQPPMSMLHIGSPIKPAIAASAAATGILHQTIEVVNENKLGAEFQTPSIGIHRVEHSKTPGSLWSPNSAAYRARRNLVPKRGDQSITPVFMPNSSNYLPAYVPKNAIPDTDSVTYGAIGSGSPFMLGFLGKIIPNLLGGGGGDKSVQQNTTVVLQNSGGGTGSSSPAKDKLNKTGPYLNVAPRPAPPPPREQSGCTVM